MRRLTASLTIIFIGLWAAGAPAWAITEPEPQINDTVTGPFSGTTYHDLNAPALMCNDYADAPDVFDLTVRPGPDNPMRPRMLGTLHIEVCSGGRFPYELTGDFLFTSSRGATLSGAANGVTDARFPAASLDMTLEVTHGTSSFKRVTGHIDLSGTWSTDGGVPVAHGQASGTSTGALQQPK
jgi:hypothetical protein